ncbi:4-hydroxy-tetrahydrodipicolinate reductase [soil metagenome]
MTAAPVRIAIAGALGRMGKVVAAVVADDPRFAVAARFDRGEGEGLVTRAEGLACAHVVIDFSRPEASVELARAAVTGGPALVIGSTGMSEAQAAAVDEAATRVPVIRSGNFSLGVNLLLGLVRQAAAALPASEWDIEVFEAHHRRKVDAPSGTALMLGEAAAGGRGSALSDLRLAPHDGVGDPRVSGGIGFSVMRAGGIVGEHSVVLAAEDEILTLSPSARDRRLFARGAVAAALWIHGRRPGLYRMEHVLGLARPASAP